jgi:hypothetical protein
MNASRCATCAHIDLKSRSSIGWVSIAKCRHPNGTVIDGTQINGDYVEFGATCAKHFEKERVK